MNNGPTTERPHGLQVKLPAKAENVAVIRHALAGLAEQIGMDEAGVSDLKTVVTEACMNVVVHAYPDGAVGSLEVEAEPDDDGLTITVSDRGTGISPQADSGRASLKLGLSLIAALSSSFSISGGLGRGTEVMMRIPLSGGGTNGGSSPTKIELGSGGAELSVGRAELLEPVLARIVGALAARRDLSIERLSDAVLVTDAIADAAPSRFANGCVHLGLSEGEEGLELKLGPMEPGGAAQVRAELEVPGVGGSLEALVDELSVEEGEEGDYLVICFASVRSA